MRVFSLLFAAVTVVTLCAQPDTKPLPVPPSGSEPAPKKDEPEKEAPPELTEYMGRTIAKTMHWTGAEWLLRKNREQEENSAAMLKELKVQPGWTVCDLGSGNGYHALNMA